MRLKASESSPSSSEETTGTRTSYSPSRTRANASRSFAIGVVIAIVWIMPKLRSVGWAIGLSLVLAGALGNLSDRIFRAPGPLRGHVIDFVSVFAPNAEKFPVFNVADSAITVGGVLIVLLALLGRDYDGRSTRKSS